MIDLSTAISPADLAPRISRMWDASAAKLVAMESRFKGDAGAPVFTDGGKYTARGWTEWTQGFQYGSSILQFDATRDKRFLDIGRDATVKHMAPHITHTGVHDHGFNNVSTYGNLLRLMCEGRIEPNIWERNFYELALRVSGAVQAGRWTKTADGGGFVYSFNGPHSLFADTIRSMRSLAVAHALGHDMKGEQDQPISLLQRLLQHLLTTARYSVYYGEGRDGYDVRGRVAHESVFNTNNGEYRCPATQQGYSPFTTWTRGLAWVMLGYAEQLEFLESLPKRQLDVVGGRSELIPVFVRAARAASDFYIESSAACGVPYWDTGAPGLSKLGDWSGRPADPFNPHEPVDSSAAAIAAQALLRLGRYLDIHGEDGGRVYASAGMAILGTILDEPYLSTDPDHDGLLLHSVYHWPNRWDCVPPGGSVASGEATMWGDYHLRETCLYVQRTLGDEQYLTFFNIGSRSPERTSPTG